MTPGRASGQFVTPRALALLPVRSVTSDDLASGRVARLQAAAATEDGPVINGFLPAGPHAGPCAFVVGLDALDFAYGHGREHFSSAEGWVPLLGRRFGCAVINSDEPAHVAERRLWTPAFTNSALANCVPAMDAAVRCRISGWVESGTADAYAAARDLSFAVIAHVMIGLADDSGLRRLYTHFAAVLDGQQPGETAAAYHARVAPLRDDLEATLTQHIAAARPHGATMRGLLGFLLRSEPARSDAALLQHINILMVAGHETTASLLAWILVLLADHPAWQHDLRTELGAIAPDAAPSFAAFERTPLTDAFITEAGRLHAPLLNAPRIATDTFEYAGVRIPAGHPIALGIGASHLQPADFPEPEAFRPERFATTDDALRVRAPVTFATGARHCVGVRFARLELKLVLWRLLAGVTIARADDHATVHAGFWNARPSGGLRLLFVPRGRAHDNA